MSRTDQANGRDLVLNPCKKFLTVKNTYITEKFKGKDVKVLDGCNFEYSLKNTNGEYDKFTMDLPLEFAIINCKFVNFKGWDETEKVMNYSNEVQNMDDLITIRNKEGVLYEFTLNDFWGNVKGSKVKDELKKKEVQAKLKSLNVKQHSSIYIAVKDPKTKEFELMNLQIKGANLSGSKDPANAPSGWWNFVKHPAVSKKLYTNYIQTNDFIEEKGEMGYYSILNFQVGGPIDKEDSLELENIYEELKAYHEFYAKKPEVEVEVKKEPVLQFAEFEPGIEDDWPF